MKCNLNLIVLDLGYNLIDSEGLATLSEVVWEKLENLNLEHNKIVLVKWVAKNFHNVKSLSLGANQIEEFPQDIIELKSLENLDLYGNKISSIPQSLL
jgi:Leucine-rich repeat (LRR) protein